MSEFNQQLALEKKIGEYARQNQYHVRIVLVAFFFEQLMTPGCWRRCTPKSNIDFVTEYDQIFILAHKEIRKMFDQLGDDDISARAAEAANAGYRSLCEDQPHWIERMFLLICRELNNNKLFYIHPAKGVIPAKECYAFNTIAKEFGPSQFKDLVIET